MAKIYKNPNPPAKKNLPVSDSNPISEQSEQSAPVGTAPVVAPPAAVPVDTFVLPVAHVVPLEEFDTLLQKANDLLEKEQLMDALSLLLNLEVTDFEHIQVHELLADTLLRLNQLNLAKEQLQICVQLLQKTQTSDIFSLKDFDQILEEAGDLEDLETKFDHLLETKVTNDNFLEGTKLALGIATHHMAESRYEEAEKLLIGYRDQYLAFLEAEEEE